MSNNHQSSTASELRSVLIRWVIVLGMVGLFAVWATWRMTSAAGNVSAKHAHKGQATAPAEPEIDYWTCTMHPQVRQPEPGDCPICGMELVPHIADEPADRKMKQASQNMEAKVLYRCTMPECGDPGSSDPDSRCPVCGMKREKVETGGDEETDFHITLNERARRLAEVETTVARKRLLYKHIRTVGRVSYDETRYKMVSAWMAGRIDKLFADFTGMTVNQGDHLVEIYSPQLLTAQEEYLQAARSMESLPETQNESISENRRQVLRSARKKLELLGITDQQIDEIKASGQPMTHLVVYAPIGGTIVEKHVMAGMYVDTGDKLYTIADLTHLWLLVDLYESDLPWVHPFMDVQITTRSLPGQVFTGQIFFVDPQVDPKTRTVPVRIHVDNPALRLKPDMWVTAEIQAGLGHHGHGAVPAPDGNYACPMHPWETADQPQQCPLCQMDMVPAEKLPQYTPPTEPVPVLSVPRGAVMQTGERALVYIESKPGTYLGAEVEIGPLAHDQDGREYYPILDGLNGGERVVTRGNFAIDSQMQLAGKPSLFTARGFNHEKSPGHENPASAPAMDHLHAPTTAPTVEQTACPVMGGDIDKEVYADYRGVRIYFCCPPCIEKFKANPDKYISNLPSAVQDKLKAVDTREGADD